MNAEIVTSVLGVSLAAMLEKKTDGMRVLVCPATENPNQHVKLSSVCTAAHVLDGLQTLIDSVLKEFLSLAGGLNGTVIDVSQAFYYFSNHVEDASADAEVKHKYALSLGATNFNPASPVGVI